DLLRDGPRGAGGGRPQPAPPGCERRREAEGGGGPLSLRHKDLLSLAQLSREEIELVLDTAEACKQIFDRPVKKFPTLRGKVVVNLFYEASTRTRTSLELAGKRSEEHTSELQSRVNLVCRLLREKKHTT